MPLIVSRKNGLIVRMPAGSMNSIINKKYRTNEECRSVIDMTKTDRINIHEAQNNGIISPKIIKELQGDSQHENREAAEAQAALLAAELQQKEYEAQQAMEAALQEEAERDARREEVANAKAEEVKMAAALADAKKPGKKTSGKQGKKQQEVIKEVVPDVDDEEII